jgi:hypothetical protein
VKARIRQVVARRQRLVVRAAQQRDRLAVEVAALGQSLRIADVAVRGYRRLKSRPLLVAAALAALALLGPRRLSRFIYRGGLVLPLLLRLARSLNAWR